MSIDYSGFAWPKGSPRVLEKADQRTSKASAEKKAKADVMARDKKLCRLCGRIATEVHEALVFKSHGGIPSLQNSIAVCAQPKGLCHQLLQTHQVHVVGQHCSNPIVFELRADLARRIFGRKAIPAHVKVVP